VTAPDVPALPPRCGSWIVTSPGGRVVELFEPANVRTAIRAGWRAETALDYLGRVNAGARGKAYRFRLVRLAGRTVETLDYFGPHACIPHGWAVTRRLAL